MARGDPKHNIWMIPRSMITDNNLNGWEFIVSLYLLKNSAYSDTVILNKSYMAFYIYRTDTSMYVQNCLWKAVLSLEKKEYIYLMSANKKYYTYNIYPLRSYYWDHVKNEGGYIKLYEDEVERIMNLDTTQSKPNLLRYFAYVVSGFYYGNDVKDDINGKYCFRILQNTINDFDNGITASTINTYNKTLEDNGLLYILRSDKTIKYQLTDGKAAIRKPPNIYCRPQDKKGAVEFARTKAGWNQKKY